MFAQFIWQRLISTVPSHCQTRKARAVWLYSVQLYSLVFIYSHQLRRNYWHIQNKCRDDFKSWDFVSLWHSLVDGKANWINNFLMHHFYSVIRYLRALAYCFAWFLIKSVKLIANDETWKRSKWMLHVAVALISTFKLWLWITKIIFPPRENGQHFRRNFLSYKVTRDEIWLNFSLIFRSQGVFFACFNSRICT